MQAPPTEVDKIQVGLVECHAARTAVCSLAVVDDVQGSCHTATHSGRHGAARAINT